MAKVKTWWAGLKSEFSKIIWPNKATVVRQTVVVLVITVLVGILISVLDDLIQFGLGYIIG